MRIQNQDNTEIPHRQRILKQIDRCDALFSGFDDAPETIDFRIQQYDYTRGSHSGKKMALAVLALYAEAESILPEEFYNHFETKHRQEKAFNKRTFKEGKDTVNGYPYLSKDPHIQYEALLRIWFFYKEILNALYSLREFSDMKLKFNRKDLDLFDIDEEDNLFGEN